MSAWPDDLRLGAALVLNAFVFVSCLRLARRLVPEDPIQAALDALLLMYLVQYAAVGVTGLLGILHFAGIASVAILLAGAMWLPPRTHQRPPPTWPAPQRWTFAACTVFVIAEIAVIVHGQAYVPPLANDPLTYHLPAAVEWLQNTRIGIFETWYHNPANAYSPLAGSMFVAWLLAPLGNDALARFVQAPALVIVFLGVIQLCRALGTNIIAASLIAGGAVLSRPFVSQAILAKDDLFVAAFYICAIVGAARSDRAAPWRTGVAVGLLLATKYTALLSLPLLLLCIDAPVRAGWRTRDWLFAIATAALLAGPWYLRNWIVTGNPLFPIDLPLLPGLFTTAPSHDIRTLDGLWNTLVTAYYSTTIPMARVLIAMWIGACAINWRRFAREPLVRVCCIGPIVGIVIFATMSPYAEVRFVYPSLLLLFGCAAVLRAGPWDVAFSAVICVVGIATGFIWQNLAYILPPALLATASALAAWWMLGRLVRCQRRRIAFSITAATAAIGCLIFVYWNAYLRGPGRYADSCHPAWRGFGGGGYGELADAWQFVRSLPAEATVAYTNTHFVYPLYGFDLDRRVIHVPADPNVTAMHDLPHLGHGLSGEEIVPAVVGAMTQNADRDAWVRRLLNSPAQLLFIDKTNHPPELRFASEDPAHFDRRFDSSAAAVFEIVRN